MANENTPEHSSEPSFPLVERITGTLLILVIVAIGWITLCAYIPALGKWTSMDMQVIAILALLSAALILVSVVALLHTRGKE